MEHIEKHHAKESKLYPDGYGVFTNHLRLNFLFKIGSIPATVKPLHFPQVQEHKFSKPCINPEGMLLL